MTDDVTNDDLLSMREHFGYLRDFTPYQTAAAAGLRLVAAVREERTKRTDLATASLDAVQALTVENAELRDSISRAGYRILDGSFTRRDGTVGRFYLEKVEKP